jgi:hypothetical protein
VLPTDLPTAIRGRGDRAQLVAPNSLSGLNLPLEIAASFNAGHNRGIVDMVNEIAYI